MINKNITLLLLLCILGSMMGCRVQKIVPELYYFSKGNECNNSESDYKYDSVFLNIQDIDTMHGNLASRQLSKRAFNVAKDIRAVSTINKYLVSLQKTGFSLETMRYRQDILDRIAFSHLSVESCIKEMECEQARIFSCKGYMEDFIQHKNNKLTVLSILMGTATTIGVAFVDINPKLDEKYHTHGQIITMAASGLGTYWAFRSLKLDAKTQFKHQRNHIADVWFEKDSAHTFPIVLWSFMNKSFTSNGKSSTGLKEIKKLWDENELTQDLITEEGKQKLDIMLKEGGYYDLDMIQKRLVMYKFIIQESGLMLNDLKRLNEEILILSSK